MSLLRIASCLIVKNSCVREELIEIPFFLQTQLQQITVKEHLLGEFALTPLTFEPCTSPTDTFPFTYHFLSVSIPISESLNWSPICQVDNFQRLQRRSTSSIIRSEEGVPIFESHIGFIPWAISLGVEKLKRKFLPSSSVPSPSSTKRLKTQWKRKQCRMSLFRLLSKGINSGLLPTGRPALGVPSCNPFMGSNQRW